MKNKKLIVICIVVIVAAALAFLLGELAGAFPWQYISEDKVKNFVEDSHYAFTYQLPSAGDKVEWDSILTDDLANQIAAATYAARNEFSLDTKDDAYIISKEALSKEKENLFNDLENSAFTDSQLLTSSDNGYLLYLKSGEDSGLSFEIADIFPGLKGSEPTTVKVIYTLNGQQCELEYYLTEDKDSPYTFKVSDIELCNAK